MIQNAKKLPEVFYGLHFCEGVAEYQEPGKDPYRIFINESVAKKMDATFQGKPVYVDHVNEVDVANIQQEADGYVLESFYNKSDGKHWVKFIVVSDAGHDAIRRGWKLSNAYIPKSLAPGGLWHGVEFSKEVMDGEYEHLAIVEDPRYAESVVLTPKEFKTYNENKEAELLRLANSNEENGKMKLNIFKKTKIDNSKEVDFDSLMVQLPECKKEMTLSEVVSGYDKVLNMHGYASDEHMVKVNDKEEMSVKDLRDRCNNMAKEMEEMKASNAGGEGEDADVESMDNDVVEEPTGGSDLGQDDDKKMYAKKNEGKEDMPEHKDGVTNKKGENFNKMKNAPKKVVNTEESFVILDGVRRGKELFGSN
jgi:Uncharacterized protein conserved in bacteria (DUF2213)